MNFEKVFLVGFMCSGKSTVGELLARALEWDFVDTDRLIEFAERMSVEEIFERKGEQYFRRREMQVLDEVLKKEKVVVSTGGGLGANPQAMERMKSAGLVVWVDIDFDTFLERCGREDRRPLLKKGPELLRELFQKRREVYSEAHLRVEGRAQPEEIARIILLTLNEERRKVMKKFLISVGMPLAVLSCSIGQTSCPTQDQVKSAVKEFIPQEFNVVWVSNLKDIPGLCEVVVKVGAQSIVFYMDSKGKYIMMGNLLSVEEKKNITGERQREFMKVEKDILAELEKRVDFTYGKGNKYIYYIADPDCPFCKRAESILKEWADKNSVQIKVILFPLPIHPSAFGKSVSLICEKRSFEDLVEGNYGNKECEEGKAKVQQNLEFLTQRVGINGTPTLIGMNGRYHLGVPTEEDLKKLVESEG